LNSGAAAESVGVGGSTEACTSAGGAVCAEGVERAQAELRSTAAITITKSSDLRFLCFCFFRFTRRSLCGMHEPCDPNA
jgi:hypothetical protein